MSLLSGRSHARRSGAMVAVLAAAAAAAVFWRTAYPTITWWDSSSYSLAAATLGIESPPGSLLTTLLGWPIAHVATGAATAHALNLFAGTLAAVTVGLVVVSAALLLRIGTPLEPRVEPIAFAGAALGALAFAWGGTLWAYAVAFTPYVLTAVFTALILLVLVRWWVRADESQAWQQIGWLGLLFGLDFSVHRTNALLIPGALVWFLLRRPQTLRDRRAVLAGAGLFAAGLALQLLLIPIARFAHSPLDFTAPDDLSRLWDDITLKQLGGSFLLQLFPRKSPIWSAQTADLLRTVRDNFFRWRAAGGLGALPSLAAVIGVSVLWRRQRRMALAFSLLLLLQASLTVLYFNVPANYFRTFDRHYLPVCVTIAVLVAYGTAATAERAICLWQEKRFATQGVAGALAVLIVLAPLSQFAIGRATHDASHRYFTRDFAANALSQLPANAIYFTVGDNDTFPVMYLQAVEGVRPDVTIINLSVANVPDWPERLQARDPSLALSLTPVERRALVERTWRDSLITIPVQGRPEELGLAAATPLPDSLALNVRPVSGTHLLPAEVLLLDIVRTNGWRRPLAFAITGGESAMEWLTPYSRLDGTYSRIVPVQHSLSNPTLLRDNLILHASYRGYADAGIQLDHESRTLGGVVYPGLAALLDADRAAGALDRCRADRDAVVTQLPFARLSLPDELRQPVESACSGPTALR